MTRLYVQPSWLNAAEDHNEWSGGNDQYRGDRSIDVSTFDKNGRARVEAFSDDAIASIKEKRKTSIPLRDRILPQMKRVNTLTDQLIELEQTYKSGQMSIEEYSMLRNVLCQKRDRATELYKLAINKGNARNQSAVDSIESDAENDDQASLTPQQEIVTNTFLDELSPHNSLKLILQKALQGYRVLVSFSQQAKAYIQTLKEV